MANNARQPRNQDLERSKRDKMLNRGANETWDTKGSFWPKMSFEKNKMACTQQAQTFFKMPKYWEVLRFSRLLPVEISANKNFFHFENFRVSASFCTSNEVNWTKIGESDLHQSFFCQKSYICQNMSLFCNFWSNSRKILLFR